MARPTASALTAASTTTTPLAGASLTGVSLAGTPGVHRTVRQGRLACRMQYRVAGMASRRAGSTGSPHSRQLP